MERIESKNLESLIANNTRNLVASFYRDALQMPPPDDHYHAAAAAFLSTGNNHDSAATMFPGAQNHCLNPYGNMMNANPSFSDILYDNYPFESEFERLSLSGPRPGYVAPPPIVPAGRGSGGYNSSVDQYMSSEIGCPSYGAHPKFSNNGEIELMRNRIQSAARVHNQMPFYLPSPNRNFDGYACDPFFDYLPASRRNQNGYGMSTPRDRNGFLDYQGDMNHYSNVSNNRPKQRWSFSSLEDLKGNFLMAAKDQAGCRFLKQKIEEMNPDDIHMIFMEIKVHVGELMMDQFGNYMVQKLFEVCNQAQMTELLLLLINDERNFMAVCLDMHGTRAVQKMMDYLTTHEQRSRLITVLRNITVTLTKSMNGHHVIQHSLKNFPIDNNKHILDVIADNCLDIATDKSGCCVLQQCVHHAIGESHDRLVAEITSNALVLSEHPYGNYVVQYLLGMRIPIVTSHIMVQLSGHFVSLSMNKYGSNVVEKCIKNSQGDHQALSIVQEITQSPKFLMVLQDPYGNFVAQSALSVTRGAAREELIDLIFANYAFLHSHPHGKRVLARCKAYKMRSTNA